MWLWLVALVAGAALVVATYRGIFLRSGRRLTWALMGLRGVGILALCLALAKPTWTHESEYVEPGRVAVILDDSASMSLADEGGTTRFRAAVAAIGHLRRRLEQSRSGPRMVVDVYDLRGEPLSTLPAKPTAARTDLVRAVTAVSARLRSEPLTALVMISDGADNTGRKDFRDVGELAAPVYALGFPVERAAVLDLAVASVRAPERAMVHNAIKVDVRLTKTGRPRSSATLSLKRGREVLVSQRVDFPDNDLERTVSLNLTPDQPGRFVLTAEVAADSGETGLGNNAATFRLRVDAEPVRVLYLEGFLRYEYKYLKNRLEEDPDVSLLSVVRRANPERAEATPGERLTAESLKAVDVVILGDMEGSFLRPAEYQALGRWLDEKGHALLVLGGYHSFGSEGFRATPLAEVLPVTFADQPPYQSEEPFQLQLTEEGQRHPIFEVSGDRVRDAATWSGAPSLSGLCLVREAKPGATVLATDPQVQVGGKPAIVAAVHRFGAGHVMVLTVDTTWRWSRLTRVAGGTDTLFARFWSQTLRWLAGRSREEGRSPLVVATDQPSYEVGKPVGIRVARDSEAGRDLAAAALAVVVQGPQGARPVAVPLRASSAEPEVATGTFTAPASGRYTVVATVSAGGKPVANQSAEFVVQGNDLELAEPLPAPENLRALATANGGQYSDIRNADTFPWIERKHRRMVRVERAELWNSPWLFLGFLSAVTGEWLLRRKFHLI